MCALVINLPMSQLSCTSYFHRFVCLSLFSILVFVVLIFLIFVALSASTKTFDVNSDTYFELYTQENGDNYQVIKNVYDISLDFHRKTTIFIHGFNTTHALITKYAAKLKADCNFIAVNWLRGANVPHPLYPLARYRVKTVASALAEFICNLVQLGMDLNGLLIIGHSLGAHIAGIAGRKVHLKMEQKVGEIVALDPAAPLFSFFGKESEDRLRQTDANYVQVIHTNTPLGIYKPVGHADFYPNGGRSQPGCSGGWKCSHTRAHDLYLESLSDDFFCVECTDFEELKSNQCSGKVSNMSIRNSTQRANGIFTLQTNSKSPFAKWIP